MNTSVISTIQHIIDLKGGNFMGYYGNVGGINNNCYYGGNSGYNGSSFVLIVVLFILLIIVGASFMY